MKQPRGCFINTTMSYLNVRHMRYITGATARQLDYWEAKGLIRPSGARAGPRGWRGYTINDAILARTIKALREEGVSLPKIEDVIKVLIRRTLKAGESGDQLKTLKLVAYGGDIYVKTSVRAAYRAVDGQSTFLFIDMEQIGQEVERKMHEEGTVRSSTL